MRIDLHTHSTASDGTDSPADLMSAAGAAGLDVVALTDHDTVAGWDEAAARAPRLGIAFVPGVEISCERDTRSVHLLGYLVDPTNSELMAELAMARESRVTRLERMVHLLAADGIPITYAAVLGHVPAGATPGRPHIADALVDGGVVANRDEAFLRWLHDGSPYYVRHYAPDPLRAVRLVRAAGGVPVLAHPYAAARDAGLNDDAVAELADWGLAGIEAGHPDHTPAARQRAQTLARRLGLFVTASSDYHGAGKANRLGQQLSCPEALAEIERQGHGARVAR